MTRVILHGCNGNMGRVLTGICEKDAQIEIVAGIDAYDGIKNEYPVFTSAAECNISADVVIDFSKKRCRLCYVRLACQRNNCLKYKRQQIR